jgi:hypothetical protein
LYPELLDLHSPHGGVGMAPQAAMASDTLMLVFVQFHQNV